MAMCMKYLKRTNSFWDHFIEHQQNGLHMATWYTWVAKTLCGLFLGRFWPQVFTPHIPWLCQGALLCGEVGGWSEAWVLVPVLMQPFQTSVLHDTTCPTYFTSFQNKNSKTDGKTETLPSLLHWEKKSCTDAPPQCMPEETDTQSNRMGYSGFNDDTWMVHSWATYSLN